MKISGTHTVPFAREKTYSLLQDPAVLARCMPGTDRLDRVGDDEYEMKMKMAIASFSGLFAGKVRIADTRPPEHFQLLVEGSGKAGFLRGQGLLNLAAKDGLSTEVAYDGEVHVGGTIAGVGQRLIETTAKMIIRKFFEKLAEQS